MEKNSTMPAEISFDSYLQNGQVIFWCMTVQITGIKIKLYWTYRKLGLQGFKEFSFIQSMSKNTGYCIIDSILQIKSEFLLF